MITSHRTSRGWMLSTLALLSVCASNFLAVGASAACSGLPPITFEDVYGPCADNANVTGPASVTIAGVHFAGQSTVTYNVGKDYLGNPFDSDSFHFWTFGTGAVLTFAAPITGLQFVAGVFTSQVTYPTCELVVGGVVVTTFGANLATLTPVAVTLPGPTTQITIRFVGGSSSLLGIDDLQLTPYAGTPFCSGDGTGTACPCGNSGVAGSGCANSAFATGANLSSSGVAGASSGTDTLVLTATNVPGPGLFFQGTAQSGGSAGTVFGDGLLCAGGTITRMGVVFPTGSSASYPGGLTPNPIHSAGATTSGDVRHYQCWYRDAAVFCTSDTYNLTLGLSIIWGP